MGDRIKAERQKLLSRLKEIGQTLNVLSEQNTAATKASDWELAQRVQRETAKADGTPNQSHAAAAAIADLDPSAG